MKSSTYYFHIKTKILADFQICISVPLRLFSVFADSGFKYVTIRDYERILIGCTGPIKYVKMYCIAFPTF